MPFELELPAPVALRGWRVKIRDRERLEPHHVTILHRTRAWRYDLRGERFLDRRPPPRDIPRSVVRHVEANLDTLREQWDAMYPDNPVGVDR